MKQIMIAAALAAGNFVAADDALETALVVDPRNRGAYRTMARVAIKQKLFGQAIRLTNKALALEPTDRDALAVYHREVRTLPEDERRRLSRAQRHYIEEWVHLLAPLRPDLARVPDRGSRS